MTLDRAAEEAAIAAHIAVHGVTRLDSVDPVERALDQWRAEKDNKAGSGGGLRAMMNARRNQRRMKPKPAGLTLATPAEPTPKPKRSHKKKAATTEPHPRACAAHSIIDCARCREGAESWFAAAMQGPSDGTVVSGNISDDRHGIVGPMVALEDQVRNLAYELWEISGCRHGDDVRHWLAAERILRGDAR
jgi:hypothetical protein